MAEEQQDVAHPVHNPFDGAIRKKRSTGTTVAITVSMIFHGLLGLYLWKVKFEPKMQEYSDEAMEDQRSSRSTPWGLHQGSILSCTNRRDICLAVGARSRVQMPLLSRRE
jgi:hypothetical protein